MWVSDTQSHHHQNVFFDGETGLLPCLQSDDECLAILLEKEIQHMPAGDYLNKLRNGVLDSGARKEAIDWIEKVGSRLFYHLVLLSFSFKHGPFNVFNGLIHSFIQSEMSVFVKSKYPF